MPVKKCYLKVVYLWHEGNYNWRYVGEGVLWKENNKVLPEEEAIKKLKRLNRHIEEAIILSWEEISEEGYRYLLNLYRNEEPPLQY